VSLREDTLHEGTQAFEACFTHHRTLNLLLSMHMSMRQRKAYVPGRFAHPATYSPTDMKTIASIFAASPDQALVPL
jgi:hypothetical protein